MNGFQPIGELLPENEPKRRRKPTPDDVVLTEREELVLQLVEVGISLRKADNIASGYSYDLIRKQLRWLPYRAAKRPASLLIAAIEHDYDAPAYAPNE
ncbi:MAG: hypothetical protein KF784_00020 [Fimbriimonadaceae bacterium]|nr:hypothetical protein [Fimbriimonadaceae bacterium]